MDSMYGPISITGVLGAVDNVFMFFVAVIVGSFVAAIVVNLLKKDIVEEALTPEAVSVSVPEEEKVQEPAVHKTAPELTQAAAPVEINRLTDITNLDLIEIDLAGET